MDSILILKKYLYQLQEKMISQIFQMIRIFQMIQIFQMMMKRMIQILKMTNRLMNIQKNR